MPATTSQEMKVAIAKAVQNALATFAPLDTQRADAQTALGIAKDATAAARIEAYKNVANLAHVGKWLDSEIDDAVKDIRDAIKKKDNKKLSTLSTLASELKLCMQSSVRTYVPSACAIVAEVWENEGEEDAEKPVRALWSRQQFAVLGLLRLRQKDNTTFADADALTEHAIANAPSIDADKVAKRIAAMRKVIAAFNEDFAFSGYAAIDKLLGNLDADALAKARAKLLAETEADEDADEDADDSAPIEGSSDMLDDIVSSLGNKPQLRKKAA